MGDVPCRLKGSEEEEVGIVVEGDVLFGVAFENSKLDDWRRIDWTAICRGCSTSVQRPPKTVNRMKGTFCARTTSSGTLWLLNNVHLVCQLAPFFGHPSHAGLGLIRDGNSAGHGRCLSIALPVCWRKGFRKVDDGEMAANFGRWSDKALVTTAGWILDRMSLGSSGWHFYCLGGWNG